MKLPMTGAMRIVPRLARVAMAVAVLFSLAAEGAEAPTGAGGILDLRDWSFDKDGPATLSGEFEFFWGKHLASREVALATAAGDLDYTQVPASWNKHIHLGQAVGSYGIATYRLNLLVADRSPLAISLPELGTAYRLLIDGESVLEVGQPGPVKAKTIPRYKPSFLQFTPGQQRVELLFQVSNFHHRLGGLWLPVRIGEPSQMQTLREKALALDVALFGCVLVLGLYNLVLYAVRRENRSSLFLGLFCLLISLRAGIVGERFATLVVPDLGFEWYVRFEYLTWYLAPVAFTMFLREVFPREFSRPMVLGFCGLFGVLALVVVVTPVSIFSHTVPVAQFGTLLALAFGAFGLFMAIRHQQDGALFLLCGYLVMGVTVINDILVNNAVVDGILIFHFGIFTFAFLQSALLTYRFNQSFRIIDRQREMLQSSNIKLRTQEKLREEAEQESLSLSERIVRSEKMETIGLLAGGVAHDLNNILSEAVTYPELAMLDLPEDSPVKRPLELTRQAGLRAAAVIEDLLTLTRRGVVAREVLDFNEVIKEQLRSVAHQTLAEAHPRVNVITELSPELDRVEGSSAHLSKLLINLISNAFEATSEQGLVTLSTRNERVDGRELFYGDIPDGDYVMFTIEDEGDGISPDDLDRLFEPFFTTKVLGQSGTGLGMAVVWGVVKDHGGAIDILSEKGDGTRLDVYLPRTLQPLPEPERPVPFHELMGDGQEVLIVDDMAEQRQLLSDVLVRLGYQVMECESGSDALLILQQVSFRVIILDMVLENGPDGLDTYRELAARYPDTRVILASGFAEDDRVSEARALGAAAFIRKPFTIDSIGRTVRRVLRDY